MLIAPTVKIFFVFCRSRKPGGNLDFPESALAVVYRPLCRCLFHKERGNENILRPKSPQEFFENIFSGEILSDSRRQIRFIKLLNINILGPNIESLGASQLAWLFDWVSKECKPACPIQKLSSAIGPSSCYGFIIGADPSLSGKWRKIFRA